jgi:hypothetical protein
MDTPLLEKSKKWIERNFAGLGDLHKTTRPIEFTRDSAKRDAERLSGELNGWITGRNGRKLAVVTDYHPNLPNLIIVEFLDEATKLRAGTVTFTLLSPTRELKIGFFNLQGTEGQGFGKMFSKTLRTFIPAGVGVIFEVEEVQMKTFLLATLAKLMESGTITDWRFGSPLRPKVEPGRTIPLAEDEQHKFEEAFLTFQGNEKNPLLGIYRAFRAPFRNIRVGLNDQDKFIFQAVGVCEPLESECSSSIDLVPRTVIGSPSLVPSL